MKLLIRFAFVCASILAPIGSTAFAQVVPTAPFTGANSDSFESVASWTTTCYPERILDGTAELCAPGGQVIVAGTAHCACSAQPIGSLHAMAGNGGHLVVTFNTPAVRFGARFALNCNVPDGQAFIRDPSGTLIAVLPLSVPADCGYYWHGFEAQGGLTMGSIELFSNLTAGGSLLMDELEADYAAAVDTYCTAKPNSVNCVPRIECTGVPQAGAPSGWEVRAVRVLPGSVPGLLLYTVGGARNALPFQCGVLCLGPSGVRRSIPAQSSSSGILCDGIYSLDMNAFASGALGGNPSPGLSIPGALVHCQWWGRDQGFPAPCNSTLSDALEYVIQ